MKRILAVFNLLLLAEYATASNMKAGVQKPNFNPGKNAALVIIRARPFPIAGPIYNYLDNKFIGETITKTYFSTIVKPGLHYVIAETENLTVVRMNFKKGMIYYLYQDLSSGFWDKNNALSVMSHTEAQKSMSECEYIQYNKKNPGANLAPARYAQSIKDYNIKVKKNPEDYKSFLNYQGCKPNK
jgi:hypothetical protein